MLERFRSGWKRTIKPVARLCVRLHVGANAVTITGSILTIVAALLVGVTGQLFVGALLLTIFVLFDSLDGSVAALSGGGTRFGAFLDSTLDRIADWAMLAGIILYANLHSDLWNDSAWFVTDYLSSYITGTALYAIMVSFVTSYARARAESVGCEAKNGVATRADRLAIILIGMALTGLTGYACILAVALTVLDILGTITVIQRILEVYRQMRKE